MIHPLTPIYTPRLVLRCWKPADAPLLKEALDSSLDHLFRFALWSRTEPSSVDSIEARLAGFAADFRSGKDFVYGIFNRDETAVLGGTGLHPRNDPHDREIGYWLRQSATGQGLITESTAALTTVAYATWPLETVTIVCDPDNHRSAAVPRRLGFSCKGLVPTRQEASGRDLDLVFQVTRATWATRRPPPHALVAT